MRNLQTPQCRDSEILTEWAEEPADWDAYVAQHPWGTVYHLTAWRRSLQEAFPHIRGRFLLLRSSTDGRLHGGLPLYTVRSWLLGNRLVSVPFASFCDPLVPNGELLRRLKNEAWRFAEEQRIPSLEIRLFRAAALAEEEGLAPTLYSRHHFTRLSKPVEEIWDSFSKTSVRQRIEYAKNAGVQISKANGDDDTAIFSQMLADNRRRLGLPYIPYRFFEALRRNLGPEILFCWIARDRRGKPLSGLLGWRLGDKFAVEYSGDYYEARAIGANQLLYWHVMQAVREVGCVSFSFGRTGLDNPGLLNYKRRWGTVEEELKLIMLPKTQANDIKNESPLYRLAKQLIVKSPPGIHRLIGEFCYRHLG
jgi:hypothetical protein